MIPDAYFDGFETRKYRARGWLRRTLIRRFVRRTFDLLLDGGSVGPVLEVGVGEGFLLGLLVQRLPGARIVGVDVSEKDLALVRRRLPTVDARVASAYDLSSVEGPIDRVLCAEVLEHLGDPERAVDQIASLRPARAVFTVPHEPRFRLVHLAAGENLRRWGNDPEHVQQFGPRSFRGVLERRFRVLNLTRSFPWLLALTTPR